MTSALWQTNAVALRAGEEAMLIDSPYFPDELEMLPEVLRQSGFEPVGLIATHADWDHLLGRFAFPDASLGVAERTVKFHVSALFAKLDATNRTEAVTRAVQAGLVTL